MKQVILMVIIVLLLGTLAAFVDAHGHTTTLMVGNPYRVFLKLEVKCDWIPEKRRYSFYRIIDVPKKTNITLVVPQDMRFCEIWPLDFKLL